MLKLQSSVALNDVNHRQLPQIVTNLPKRLPAQVFAANFSLGRLVANMEAAAAPPEGEGRPALALCPKHCKVSKNDEPLCMRKRSR